MNERSFLKYMYHPEMWYVNYVETLSFFACLNKEKLPFVNVIGDKVGSINGSGGMMMPIGKQIDDPSFRQNFIKHLNMGLNGELDKVHSIFFYTPVYIKETDVKFSYINEINALFFLMQTPKITRRDLFILEDSGDYRIIKTRLSGDKLDLFAGDLIESFDYFENKV